jgi:heme oxygenase
MLQKVLKEATNAKHTQLEALMHVDKIMHGTLTPEEYRQILTINYKVHQVLEAPLFHRLNPAVAAVLQLAKRHKLPALIKDMEEAGVPFTNDFITSLLFNNSNDAYNLGAMYVLEGATLGGHVINKRLRQNSYLQSLNLGYHYYGLYGEGLMQQWQLFCDVLNQLPVENTEMAIKGANDVFDQYIEVHNNLVAENYLSSVSN